MRTPRTTDFIVPVPGIGDFTFGRRTLGDQLAIRAEFSRLTGGAEGDEALVAMATMLAAVTVLTVRAPAPWDNPAAVDLVGTPDALAHLMGIYNALRDRENELMAGPIMAASGGAEPHAEGPGGVQA